MKMKFTKEQKQQLEKEGYLIFQLSGKTLEELRDKTYFSWWKGKDFKKEKGRMIEVAVNPNSEIKYGLTFDEAIAESKKPTGIKGTKYDILSALVRRC